VAVRSLDEGVGRH